MSENGPKLLAYVGNGMVQRNVELQWYISDFANCNGTSQSWKNCNGTNPNIPFFFQCSLPLWPGHPPLQGLQPLIQRGCAPCVHQIANAGLFIKHLNAYHAQAPITKNSALASESHIVAIWNTLGWAEKRLYICPGHGLHVYARLLLC